MGEWFDIRRNTGKLGRIEMNTVVQKVVGDVLELAITSLSDELVAKMLAAKEVKASVSFRWSTMPPAVYQSELSMEDVVEAFTARWRAKGWLVQYENETLHVSVPELL